MCPESGVLRRQCTSNVKRQQKIPAPGSVLTMQEKRICDGAGWRGDAFWRAATTKAFPGNIMIPRLVLRLCKKHLLMNFIRTRYTKYILNRRLVFIIYCNVRHRLVFLVSRFFFFSCSCSFCFSSSSIPLSNCLNRLMHFLIWKSETSNIFPID